MLISLDDEERIRSGITAVAGACEINRAANAAPLDCHQNRNTRAVDDVEGILDVEDATAHIRAQAAAFLGRTCSGVLGGTAAGEGREVHAGGEMLASGGDQDDACLRVIVDIPHDLGQLTPEFRHHGVEFVAALELDMRDVVGDLDVEAAIGHDSLLHRMVFSSAVSTQGREFRRSRSLAPYIDYRKSRRT